MKTAKLSAKSTLLALGAGAVLSVAVTAALAVSSPTEMPKYTGKVTPMIPVSEEVVTPIERIAVVEVADLQPATSLPVRQIGGVTVVLGR